MENRTPNGAQTNHDRDMWTNGVREGATAAGRELSPESGGKKKMGDGTAMDVGSDWQGLSLSKMDELPDELQHITTGILPLDVILTRLAQFSHAMLQDQILTLASKPLPQSLPNGNASYQPTGAEDTSPESVEKKVLFLNFIQELHTKWVKTLVITEWSKKADQVGKLIDIRSHLIAKLELFNSGFWDMIKTKQDMLWAKVPSPDLKTALEVLATGEASWMPDLGYLEPPPLSLQQKEAWVHEINIHLAARLQLQEQEKIPAPFRNYTIDSGRVTFRVEGEFEVDLTIGDEDFESQFWFIDFRCLFRPAPSGLSDGARAFLEAKVNQALAAEGLLGCYKYLHEFTLTAKIGEFTRQAVELSKAKWVDTLKIERLNRAMAIQYWLNRPHSQGTKSWIILGVNSDKAPGAVQDPESPSHLGLRWFRDNKEVKDADIPFDVDTISTENLLTTVVGRHTEHLLSSMYNSLLSKPRFARRQTRLSLNISRDEVVDSSLSMQLLDEETVTVQVEPFTGAFVLLPRTAVVFDGQRKFNSMANPAEEGAAALEQLRWIYTMKDLHSRGKTVGWAVLRPPVPAEELKNIVYSTAPPSREPFQAVWMRYADWDPRWFVMMSMSLGGDHWWLIELSWPPNSGPPNSSAPGLGLKQAITGRRIKMFVKIPVPQGRVNLSDSFFDTLAEFGSAIIFQINDLRDLHSNKLSHTSKDNVISSSSRPFTLPTIYARLSEMLQHRPGQRPSFLSLWANEVISIDFKGLGPPEEVATARVDALQRREMRTTGISEARVRVSNRAKFQFIKGHLDHDVFYNHRIGEFRFRLRVQMGTPSISVLVARLRALERVLDFVDAIRRAGKDVVPESVTLREVVFTYGGTQEQRPWKVRLDVGKEQRVNVILEKGNPHLRIIDYLRAIANSTKFEELPLWLNFTLPLCRSLERLEDAWERVVTLGHGTCFVFHNAPGWVGIRFSLVPTHARRVLQLVIRARRRRGQYMWFVSRSENDPNARNENDEFNKVLKQRVWSASGDGFKGLSTGAQALPDRGIENLLALISDSILSMVGTPPPPRLQPLPQPQGQGQAQTQQQQQQQQGIPGQQRGAWVQA